VSQKKSASCPLSVVFPLDVVKALDQYRAQLGSRRGSRVSRSTVIREIVHAALAPTDKPGPIHASSGTLPRSDSASGEGGAHA